MSEFPLRTFVFETAGQRWLKRLFLLVGAGFCFLILAAVSLVEWFTIRKARDLESGASSVVSVKADAVDKANDGKLVHVTGETVVTGELKDEDFGIVVPKAVRLQRKVAMRQWKEKPQPKKDGKEVPPKYELDWSESVIKSSGFKEQTGHINPVKMDFEKKDWKTDQKVTLGAFELAPSLADKMPEQKLPMTDELLANAPADLKGQIGVEDGKLLVHAGSRNTPTPGDLRIEYSVVKPQLVSVLAGQQGNVLGPYKPANEPDAIATEELAAGTLTAEQMFQRAQAATGLFAWVGRVFGWGLLLVAFYIMLPSFGYRNTRLTMPHKELMPSVWLSAFAGAFALVTLFSCLGVVWVALAPGLGSAIVVPGLAGLVGLYILRSPGRTPPPPEREPQPVQAPVPIASLEKADPMGTIKRLEGKVALNQQLPNKPPIAVSLASTGAGDMDLAHLRGLTTVQVLNLESCYGVSDGGLAYLADLINLRDLNLDSTGVNGDGFVFLSKLAGLKKLTLPSYTNISSAHLALLARLPQLEELKVYLRERVDAKFEVLATFPKLKRIEVEFGDATNQGLAHLSGMANLQALKVRFCDGITDAGLTHLVGLTNLRELDLYGAKITDAGLIHLAGLTNLEILRLTGEGITNAGLANIQKFTKLKELHLVSTSVTDAGLEQLIGLTALKHIALDGSPVTGSGLERLTIDLEVLHLDDTKFGDAGAAVLRKFPNLKELDLDNAALTDAGLAHFRGLVKLKRLMLDGTKITTVGLDNLKGMRELKWLRLDNNPKITDAAADFLKGLATLEKLNVEKTKITKKGVVGLQAALPKAEISH